MNHTLRKTLTTSYYFIITFTRLSPSLIAVELSTVICAQSRISSSLSLCCCLTLKKFPDFLPDCVSLRINSCPNNCSGHGRCSTANSVSGRVYCECEDYWKGDACNIPYCRDNCGSPDHGYCDLTGEKLCVCNDSWQGKREQDEWDGRQGGEFIIREIKADICKKWGGLLRNFGSHWSSARMVRCGLELSRA